MVARAQWAFGDDSNSSAQAHWAAYVGDHADIKAGYKGTVQKANFRYAPPTAGNEWRGADKLATETEHPQAADEDIELPDAAPSTAWDAESAREHFWLKYSTWYLVHYEKNGIGQCGHPSSMRPDR